MLPGSAATSFAPLPRAALRHGAEGGEGLVPVSGSTPLATLSLSTWLFTSFPSHHHREEAACCSVLTSSVEYINKDEGPSEEPLKLANFQRINRAVQQQQHLDRNA
mmetsp:Transcript_80456/g.176408  ORF Transcript_80456/g.176408 Transcript_80456/m.176408 type:complete len:106 (+) Transcript_80456:1786-2103(+)